jgi:SAM-dependent methyltransferase
MHNCRFCNFKIEKDFLNIGKTPLANSFLSKRDIENLDEICLPLKIYFCEKCHLIQVPQYCVPEKIFKDDYAYYSSYSSSWIKHCENYFQKIMKKLKLYSKSLVIEVGSNDGCLLDFFNKDNIPVLGVEPSVNVAQAAIARGVDTKTSFFNSALVDKLLLQGKKADLLIANNVIAHTPYLNDFVSSINKILKKNGIATIEFPHVLNLLKYCQFDTIYHEHFSYFSLHSIKKIFEFHGLDVFDVDSLVTHGGSLRLYVKKKINVENSISNNVQKILDLELQEKIFSENSFVNFKNNTKIIRNNFISFLKEAKLKQKKVVGYGAPAKGNTLLNYCNITNDLISYTVDKNIHKQNKYLPGSLIPIHNPSILKTDKPDFIIIFPWNLKNEIINEISFVKDWGCKFVLLLPEFLVI